MFKKRRHIRANADEWVHVHRNNNHASTGQIVITGVAWLIVIAVVYEILKALLPYLLIVAMIGGVGFAFLNRRSS